MKSRTTQAAAVMYSSTTQQQQYEESGGDVGGLPAPGEGQAENNHQHNNGISVNGLYEADFAIESNEVDVVDDGADDEDRAFKEIDDLYEYVRSGILPEYLKAQVSVSTAPAPVPAIAQPAHNNNTDTITTAMMSSRSKLTANNPANRMTSSAHQDIGQEHHYQQHHNHHHHPIHHHQPAYHASTQNISSHHHYQQQQQQQQQQHHPLHSQHIGSSVTAVTPTVCTGSGTGGVGNGGDETRDHSELFDVSTATNTRKTFKMSSQKNGENVSGNSSYRIKKGKGKIEQNCF